jgi:2-dehydropantoate 2-reductase
LLLSTTPPKLTTKKAGMASIRALVMIMKRQILIVGQGNIGTFVGLALNQSADNNVYHFIRHKNLKPSSVILNFSDRRNTKTKIKKSSIYNYQQTNNATDIAKADFIFVPVRFAQWKEVIQAIRDKLNKNQTLVICGNVLDEFEWFEKNIPCPYVFAFPNFGGAIINGKLQGWLTANFTVGITNDLFQANFELVSSLLSEVGFEPTKENVIKGWLMTHFAYNAGMLSEAALQDGFQKMTKSFNGLKKMYVAMRNCVNIIKDLGIDVTKFPEGREAYAPLWWNIIKTYFVFLIPGLAKSADATKNIKEWMSYLEALKSLHKNQEVPVIQ